MKKQIFFIVTIIIIGSLFWSCTNYKNKKVLNQYKSKELRTKALGFTFAGITDSALIYFDSSLYYNKKYTEAYVGKSMILTQIERYPEALKNIDKAIKYDKKNGSWYYNRGYILFKQLEYEKAIKSFNTCIQYESNLMKRAHYLNGLIYLEISDTIKAVSQFEKAYELGFEEAYEYIFLYKEKLD